MMNPELKKRLEELARKESWTDDEDFNPFELCGGNFDECYYNGLEDGETVLARQLLKEFGDSL